MKLFTSRVVCSHGTGNQFFQLTFAHFLNRKSQDKIIVENSPFFPKGLNYMLENMHQFCDHISYRNNIIISHENLLGRIIMKLKKVNAVSNLIMQNYFIKKIYSYNESELFDFNNFDTSSNWGDKQYFGFFLNWEYVYSERDTVVPDILKLIEDKSKNFSFHKSNKKMLVIHVRRGDYLTRGNDEILGVIDPNSYKLLVESIMKQEIDIEIITITDDDDLVKNPSYGAEFGKIFTKSEINEWQALRIMVDADYVIAANSTFSWWGATLSYLKNNSTCFIPEKFYKTLDDKGCFLLPGLKTYRNLHL